MGQIGVDHTAHRLVFLLRNNGSQTVTRRPAYRVFLSLVLSAVVCVSFIQHYTNSSDAVPVLQLFWCHVVTRVSSCRIQERYSSRQDDTSIVLGFNKDCLIKQHRPVRIKLSEDCACRFTLSFLESAADSYILVFGSSQRLMPR